LNGQKKQKKRIRGLQWYFKEAIRMMSNGKEITHLNNKNPIPVTAALRTSSLTSETFKGFIAKIKKMEIET
jgi:hypothetical protein